MTFRASQDGKWTTRFEIVWPDGFRNHAESTASLDGVPVPVSGKMDFIDSVALRQPAPDTLVMTLGKAGARVSTRVYTVAKDLNSMTETIVWSSDKLQKLETTHFNRIRSEEHTSELQSLMRTSYAVFCMKKKTPKDCDTLSLPRQYRTVSCTRQQTA